MVELHCEESAPAACAAGLFVKGLIAVYYYLINILRLVFRTNSCKWFCVHIISTSMHKVLCTHTYIVLAL